MRNLVTGTKVLLAAVAIWAGGACGSVSGDKPDASEAAGDFTLTATPAAVDIPIASSANVTIAVDRMGAVGDVMLSAPTLPAGITATFSPNPVPVGANSTTVTFSVAAGTAAGTSNVTLSGSAGGNTKTVTIAVTAKTITVAGTIRGGRSGVTVRIVGKPAVTSGATGGFTFTDVSPPYDLYIVGQSGLAQSPFPTVYYYKGLTRPDPIVTAPATFFLTLFTSSNAPVSGVKSGNADVTNQMLIAWESGGSVVVNPSGYSLTASWSPAASTKAGTLYGFQFSKKATGAPDVFTGFGSSGQVTLTQNTASLINLSMPAPTTAALTGTITAPAGFPNPTIQLNQQIGTGTVNLWNSSPTTAADATIPVIASGKSAMAATSTLDGATTQFVHPSINAATSVAFALPAPAVQTAPVNAATGVTTTTPFTWSPTPMTVYELNIGSTTVQGSAKARFQVFTTTPMATIPQVPELVLPSNQSFTWFVNGYGPNVSIDDAASATGLLTVSATDYTNTVVHSFTNSTDRTLTSAP